MSEQREYTQDELLRLIVNNTERTARHAKRVSDNVAFFFWIVMISCILGFLSGVFSILVAVS
jgi:hypothetical protein